MIGSIADDQWTLGKNLWRQLYLFKGLLYEMVFFGNFDGDISIVLCLLQLPHISISQIFRTFQPI